MKRTITVTLVAMSFALEHTEATEEGFIRLILSKVGEDVPDNVLEDITLPSNTATFDFPVGVPYRIQAQRLNADKVPFGLICEGSYVEPDPTPGAEQLVPPAPADAQGPSGEAVDPAAAPPAPPVEKFISMPSGISVS